MTGFDKARYNKVPFQSQVFIAALIFLPIMPKNLATTGFVCYLEN